jgi:hypothetical protein
MVGNGGVNTSFSARGTSARPNLRIVSTNWTVAPVDLMIGSEPTD